MTTHGRESEPAFSGVFSSAFLAFLVAALALGYGARELFSAVAPADDSPRPVSVRGELPPEEQATCALFEAASPAVVYIQSKNVQADLFERRYEEVPEGSGSGFVWDAEGHIVTNWHVVRGARIFTVSFHDGAIERADLVGAAPDYDLAVLSVDVGRERLHPLPIGQSTDLRVGQRSFAIGYPFGLEQTLTTGVISGLDRAIQAQSKLAIHGVIQTDAAINPGNSGGPLLDSAGRLIGVNTAIATPTGANTGVGFAVPVDTVNRIVPRILREGMVERAGLGVSLGSDILARGSGVSGAVLVSVNPGGPADRAGLQGATLGREGEVVLGDVIQAVNGSEIRGQEDLFQALEPFREGDEVALTVSRAGRSGRRSEEVRVRLAPLLR